MKTRYLNQVLIAALVLALAAASPTSVAANPFSKIFSGDVSINGQPAPLGTVVEAYNQDGIFCGDWIVGAINPSADSLDPARVGTYGFMPVYGDDPWSADSIEGATSGDIISFTVNGLDAALVVDSGDVFWMDKGFAKVNLSVDFVTVDMVISDPAPYRIGKPGETVRVYVGVQNLGSGLDFYNIEAVSTLGWTLTPMPDFAYAEPGQVAWAYFDVELPIFPGANRIDDITYTVYSNVDPGVSESGALQVTVDAASVYIVSLVDPPSDQSGDVGTTLYFTVGARNDGNESDDYVLTASSDLGWTVNIPAGVTHAEPGETVYFLFSVELPASIAGDNETSNISYEVASQGDPNQTDGGSVLATANAVHLIYAMVLEDPPFQQTAEPDHAVRFNVGVRNTGDLADQYYITAAGTVHGWTVSPEPGLVNAPKGQLVYLYFDVVVPPSATDGETEHISYTVHSNGDPAVSVSSSVSLVVDDPTDVEDPDLTILPDRVHLAQNYPNPFNPTTTITFSLPVRSNVRLEVIDILGRTVDGLDLGRMSAGDHRVEYNALGLASGVYFYRLETDHGSQTRKMILLK